MNRTLKTVLRITEFILLFFGIPMLIYFDPNFIYPSAIVLPVLVGIFLYLRKIPEFRFRELIQMKLSKKELYKHVLIVLITTIVLLFLVYFFDRENLFNLPKGNLLVWIGLCTFYPLFSAYGQEIIYRVFLYYRYRSIFKSKFMFVFASSIAFSFVHIVYYSHISIILTFLLGAYLAVTYLKTKSVLFTSILHGIFGDLIFTIGLGSYFWLDMVEWL